MNKKKAEFLAGLAKKLRYVEKMNIAFSVVHLEIYPESSGCFFATARKNGLIEKELAEKLQWSDQFSEYFKVKIKDAGRFLFVGRMDNQIQDHTTGRTYYKYCKELLTKYKHGDLLD